jgi:putative ABC transport system permease protein
MGRWRNLIHRRSLERDLNDEVSSYLELLVDEKQRAGMSVEKARRAAQIELGGVEQVKEEVREVRAGRMLEELWQDLRYGFRVLSKNAGFSGIAVLALALGIGANTAMFSVAYGILLRPLPYPDAGRVAMVFERFFPRDNDFGTMCVKDYLAWKAQNHSFEEPSVFSGRRVDVIAQGQPEQVGGTAVTAGFFPTLRVKPILGRVFAAGEDAPNATPLVVLGESLWRRRFSARREALGQPLLVNGVTATIIGVMPRAFQFPYADTEVWTNLRVAPPARYGPWILRGVARLRPAATMEQAQRETNGVGRRLMRDNPYYKRLTMPILPLRDALVGRVRPALMVLVGAVGLVLLTAVVNVANLTLARATVREREIALRLSLGARRGRIVRQLLTESLLLALAGGLAGLALAYGGIELLRAWNPGNLPLIDHVRLDARAFGFMLAIALATGILFGAAPAFVSSQADLNSTLNEGGRAGTTGRGRQRARAVLVVSEVALSLMLLVGAGLLLRSLLRLQQMPAGFTGRPEQILTMTISPSDRKYDSETVLKEYYDRVVERAQQYPGVISAAVSDALPPDRQGDADTFVIQGQSLAPGELNPVVSDAVISPDYFQALQVPLLQGRFFNEHDKPDSPPVVIVSEALARKFLADRNPIGARLKQSGPGLGDTYMEIVGVVGDVKYLGLADQRDMAYYMVFGQNYSFSRRMYLVVRTARDAAAIQRGLQREIQKLDPAVTLAQVATMQEALGRSVAQPRFDAMLLGLFAAIALTLAAVGIYGVIAYSVAQRTHEIGVRMALGAGRGDVLEMVIRQAAKLAVTGIALGLAGAFALTRLLANLLFGTSTTDGATFLAVTALLMGVALAASWVPAWRATRISPVSALRCD